MRKFIIFLIIVIALYVGYFLLQGNNGFSLRFLNPSGEIESRPDKGGTSSMAPVIQTGANAIKEGAQKVTASAQNAINQAASAVENSSKSWLASQIDNAANKVEGLLGLGNSSPTTSASAANNDDDTIVAMSVRVNQDTPFSINVSQLISKLGNGQIIASINWGDGNSQSVTIISGSDGIIIHRYAIVGIFTAQFVFSEGSQSVQDSVFLSVIN